jgi:hypothetical protein
LSQINAQQVGFPALPGRPANEYPVAPQQYSPLYVHPAYAIGAGKWQSLPLVALLANSNR